MPEEAVVDGAMQATPVTIPDSTESPVPKPGVQTSGLSNETHQGRPQPQNGNEQGEPRKESRYERTKRERALFRSQQQAFAQERARFAQERAQYEESKKPKRDYTLADLKKYRNEWNSEGNYDLVEKADKEIAIMEAEAEAERKQRTVEMPPYGSAEHTREWRSAEQELAQSDSEFLRSGTRLDSKLRAIMDGDDGRIYRQHPRGIVAAYHRARMELLEEDAGALRTENSKLKTELQRLTGLTSIGGGAPGTFGNGSSTPFEKQKTADMRKHLLESARRNSLQMF